MEGRKENETKENLIVLVQRQMDTGPEKSDRLNF